VERSLGLPLSDAHRAARATRASRAWTGGRRKLPTISSRARRSAGAGLLTSLPRRAPARPARPPRPPRLAARAPGPPTRPVWRTRRGLASAAPAVAPGARRPSPGDHRHPPAVLLFATQPGRGASSSTSSSSGWCWSRRGQLARHPWQVAGGVLRIDTGLIRRESRASRYRRSRRSTWSQTGLARGARASEFGCGWRAPTPPAAAWPACPRDAEQLRERLLSMARRRARRQQARPRRSGRLALTRLPTRRAARRARGRAVLFRVDSGRLAVRPR